MIRKNKQGESALTALSAAMTTPDPTTRDPAASLRACIELAAKATPGPLEAYAGTVVPAPGSPERVTVAYCSGEGSPQGEADAEAIAAAVNFLRDDAPALLAEVAAAKARIAALEQEAKVQRTVVDIANMDANAAEDRAEAAEQVARELREALTQIRDSTFRSALQLRSIAERSLAHHGARTGESND